MPLVVGLDLGTTTITALTLDAGNGEIVARNTLANNQASFFGSVAELDDTVLVNVGTGG
jgi:sugar (pentulose or hexulose) kinase